MSQCTMMARPVEGPGVVVYIYLNTECRLGIGSRIMIANKNVSSNWGPNKRIQIGHIGFDVKQ